MEKSARIMKKKGTIKIKERLKRRLRKQSVMELASSVVTAVTHKHNTRVFIS